MSGEGGGRRGEVLDELLAKSGAPVKLYEAEGLQCPACGAKALKVEEYIYEVPVFGHIILTVGSCRSCGYKFRDVRLAEQTEPKKIIVRVEGERELRYLVARSPLSAILIPEAGLEMVPARASLGFITTVEGVLWRFHEVAKPLCGTLEDEERRARCLETLSWIERAIEGKESFTLVICDYDGKSKVVGDKVEVGELDEECRSKCPECLSGQATQP